MKQQVSKQKYDSTNMSIGIITLIYTPQKEAIWTYGALLQRKQYMYIVHWQCSRLLREQGGHEFESGISHSGKDRQGHCIYCNISIGDIFMSSIPKYRHGAKFSFAKNHRHLKRNIFLKVCRNLLFTPKNNCQEENSKLEFVQYFLLSFKNGENSF